MATSGASDFSVNAQEVVKAAIRTLISERDPSADEISEGREALNMIVKQWMGPSNFMMPGFKVWKRKHVTIALSSNIKYTLRFRRLAFTSGGTYEISLGDTISGATSSATAKVCSIEVTSGTWAGDSAVGELIIYDQAATFQSENINVGVNGNVATISGDSTQYGPPNEIREMVRRTTNNVDHPMTEITLPEWMSIPDKNNSSNTGTPEKFYLEKRVDSIILHLNTYPSDTTDVLYMVLLMPVEDLDGNTDTLDYPREYFRALKFQLALDLAPEYGGVTKKVPNLERRLVEALALAQTFHPEYTAMYYQPDKDDE